jgi:hypothetical protein
MRRRHDPSVDRWAPLSVAHVREVIAGSPAWLSGDGWWDPRAGEAVGYFPQDDAAALSIRESHAPDVPQGGSYATPAYSTDRMRR